MFKKLIKFFCIFLGLTILILTVLPVFFNKENLSLFIQDKVNKEFNLDFSFDKNLSISLFPLPKLVVKDVAFNDSKNFLELKISKVKLVSSWNSLLKLNPEFKSIELISPDLKIKKNFSARKNIIFVQNDSNKYPENVKFFISKIDKLRVTDGKVDFFYLNKKNSLNNVNFLLTNFSEIEINAKFNYQNYGSFFKVEAKTKDLRFFKYSINQLFDNKDEIISTGEVKYDPNNIVIKGDIYSNRLNIFEIFKVITQITKLKKNKNISPVSLKTPNINFSFDLEFDNVLIRNHKLQKVSSKIFSAKNEVIIQNLRMNYLESLIKTNATYYPKTKKVKGKISVLDFMVDKNFLGSNHFDISNASFDCDVFFTIDNNKKIKIIMDKFTAKGTCAADSAILVGISLDKISSGVDNLETFQDFFDLFNKEKMRGDTKIDSINLHFDFKNSILFLREFLAVQKNIKVLGVGQFNLNNQKLRIKNNIFIKTKKFDNLPGFVVLVSGTPDKYDVSYDFEEIKSAVLTTGINSILKKKKKIVIDPKSFKDLIDKNSDNFKPEKIIDLFLN